MTLAHALPVVPAPSAPARVVTVLVHGIPVTVPEPVWCTVDHSLENLAGLEDVHHDGAKISMSVPMYGGGTEQAMVAHIAQWPFTSEDDEDHGEPYLGVDVDNSGEVTPLHQPAALAYADQLVAYAEEIRRLASAL